MLTRATRRPALWRRAIWALLPFVMFVTIFESIGWIADARSGFRRKLLEAFRLMEVNNQPIEAESDLPWPEGTVVVRSPEETTRSYPPYVLGGRQIADAHPSTDTAWLRPKSTVHEGEKRVFILGGSAAYGFPYAYQNTFASLLDEKLGNRGYRVFNASQVGCSSGRLVPVAKRIVEGFSPAVLVIFAGNNEWIQWEPKNQSSIDRQRVRAMRFFAHSRALAGVEYLVLKRSITQHDQPVEPDTFVFHRELVGPSYALAQPLEDPTFDPQQWLVTKQRYLDVFAANLTQIVELGQTAGARVILMTVPFNYKLSPAWKHPQPESFAPEHKEAVVAAIHAAPDLINSDKYEEALQQIDKAIALDPLPPVLHHLRGFCLEALGRLGEAEEAYAQCRENMIGNLGSRLSINEVIVQVADNTGADLVDLRRKFDAWSHAEGNHFNSSLIHDDCHPTPEAHRLVAEELEKVLLAPGQK